MPSQTTEDGTTQLAAIELRYELAKARIAGVAVARGHDDRVHDTVAVDVPTTRPPLFPVRRRADDEPAPGSPRTKHRAAPVTDAGHRGRQLWRSLRIAALVRRTLPTS